MGKRPLSTRDFIDQVETALEQMKGQRFIDKAAIQNAVKEFLDQILNKGFQYISEQLTVTGWYITAAYELAASVPLFNIEIETTLHKSKPCIELVNITIEPVDQEGIDLHFHEYVRETEQQLIVNAIKSYEKEENRLISQLEEVREKIHTLNKMVI